MFALTMMSFPSQSCLSLINFAGVSVDGIFTFDRRE